MQTVTIPYGDTTIDVELPDRARVIHRTAEPPPPLPDQERAIRDAIAHPIGIRPIPELVRPGARVLIAFDDPTSQTRGRIRALAIEAVLDELRRAGVREENVTLVCANALHRKFTHEELAVVLGPELVARFGERLMCHDAEDRDNLVTIGTTANGYLVEVNRLVVDCDLTVYVNSGVNLGFSGGWKSVCVGLSTWNSIKATHHPDGMSMSVRNNRMHRVLDEMGALLEARLGRPIFKVEMILSDPEHVAYVWAGSVAETRARAMEVMAERNPPRRAAGEPVDVVVYGVPNQSPYAVFSKVNPILTLISSGLGYQGGYIEALGKPGCSVVLATPCTEQWDEEHHPSYPDVWRNVLSQTTDAYEIDRRFAQRYAEEPRYIERYRHAYGFHGVHAVLATQPLKRLKHAGRVFVAGPDDPVVPRHVGFIPVPSVEAAIRDAERVHGPDCAIACIV